MTLSFGGSNFFLADVYHEKKEVFEREAGQCNTKCLCTVSVMFYCFTVHTLYVLS